METALVDFQFILIPQQKTNIFTIYLKLFTSLIIMRFTCICIILYFVFFLFCFFRMPYNCSICSCKLVTEALTFDLELTGFLLLLLTDIILFRCFSGLPLQPESCTCAWCLSERFLTDMKGRSRDLCVKRVSMYVLSSFSSALRHKRENYFCIKPL